VTTKQLIDWLDALEAGLEAMQAEVHAVRVQVGAARSQIKDAVREHEAKGGGST